MLKTTTRYFPKGHLIIRPRNVNAEFAIQDAPDRMGKMYYYVIAYIGKASRPAYNERYSNAELRDKRIKSTIAAIERNAAWKAEQKAKRVLTENPVQPGHIFYTSWGYDQTNVEFFQVIEVKGQFATLREVAQGSEDAGFMSENVVARPGEFCGVPIRKKILTSDGGKSVYFRIDYTRHAWQWDGRPKYASHYA